MGGALVSREQEIPQKWPQCVNLYIGLDGAARNYTITRNALISIVQADIDEDE